MSEGISRKSMTKETVDVLMELLAERERQDAKWGVQDHPSLPMKARILAIEEFFEAVEAAVEEDQERGNEERTRAELVQAGAVIVAAIESIDRRAARRLTEEKGA